MRKLKESSNAKWKEAPHPSQPHQKSRTLKTTPDKTLVYNVTGWTNGEKIQPFEKENG